MTNVAKLRLNNTYGVKSENEYITKQSKYVLAKIRLNLYKQNEGTKLTYMDTDGRRD